MMSTGCWAQTEWSLCIFYTQRGTLVSRAVALVLLVAASMLEAGAARSRRRNQKFWKGRQRFDRNNDDYYRSSDGDLVYVGKGAAGGHQVNMGFKFPTQPTTVSRLQCVASGQS